MRDVTTTTEAGIDDGTDPPRKGPGPTTSQVRAALESVTDPELDRSIVELEYVDRIDVDGRAVTVAFTLPTAWCSPAFAWMMAVDARDAVEDLAGAETATVVLREHLHEDEITRGVNARRSFAETFPDADGTVDAVRRELDRKARTARQYAAVETLLEAGLDGEQVSRLRLRDLERLDGIDRIAVETARDGLRIVVPAGPIDAYLEKARATDVVSTPDAALFRTPEGEPIDPDAFDLVHRRGRLARVNMSSQGGICDGLRRARERRLDGDGDGGD